MIPNKKLQLDDEGFPVSEGVRLEDQGFLNELFSNLMFKDNFTFESKVDGERIFVESFQSTLVAQQVHRENNTVSIQLPGQIYHEFDPKTLRLDLYDRYHGITDTGLPFVLSRKAQFELFNIVDDYDDDSIQIGETKISTPDLFSTSVDVNTSDFWTQKYIEMDQAPPWELNTVHPMLEKLVPSLKLIRSKVINLGSGSCNDAAFFAENGHLVTAVDFSDEAIANAQKKYGQLENLNVVKEDIFKLPSDFDQSYDLVVEHTCFAAIEPNRRQDLVSIWRKLLRENGHFLGIFFIMPKYVGPPFGTSEWEIKNLLEKSNFQVLLWNRDIESPEGRAGKELIVYAQKKNS